MEEKELLFALLRMAVCGAAAEERIRVACTPEMLEKVYAIANHHDLAHLVGQAASKLDLPESEAFTKCKQTAMQAFARYMQLNYTYEQTCAVLEDAKIPFIPLKGSVLRDYYPEPWMRTSCDMDILVKEEMLDDAVKVLSEKLNYTVGIKGEHDISLFSANGVHLELHFDTIRERSELVGSRAVLDRVWDDAKPKKSGSCHYVLSDAMFYFYHIAHMAKHFGNGGCGIRTFLDIWVLNHKVEYDRALREELLRIGTLLKFAQAAESVTGFWFCEEAPDQLTLAVSDYILRSGVYGDSDNRAAMGQARMGSGVKYLLLRRVFMPYDYLKAEYPILNTHKWLTPFYQVVRWCQMIFRGGLRRACNELKANTEIKKDSVCEASALIKQLGL